MHRSNLAMCAIVGSGSLGGVMLAIGLGLGSYWLTLDPQAFDLWLTQHFIYFLPCVVLSVGPALPSAALCWRSAPAPSRSLWRKCTLGLLVMLGVTTVVHLPLNLWVWFGAPIPDATLQILLVGWLAAHMLRLSGALGAAFYGVRALVAERS